jgi:hypothetical protein
MKILKVVLIAAACCLVANVAFAAVTVTANVARVSTSSGSGKFFVFLDGGGPHCGSGSQSYAFVDNSNPTFRDEVTKIAIAAQLSRKDVELTMQNESNACRITQITINQD